MKRRENTGRVKKLKATPKNIVRIETPLIKLDSLLKLAGIALTGGEAKEMITGGLVTVDGECCTVRGRKVFPGQRVRVQGHPPLLVADGSLHES